MLPFDITLSTGLVSRPTHPQKFIYAIITYNTLLVCEHDIFHEILIKFMSGIGLIMEMKKI